MLRSGYEIVLKIPLHLQINNASSVRVLIIAKNRIRVHGCATIVISQKSQHDMPMDTVHLNYNPSRSKIR
jgi:hypothetical protein